MRKVYIRVDASTEIGLGHLVRCVALAHMLKNDFRVFFVCKHLPDESIADLKKQNFEIITIKNEDFFISQVTNKDIVVLDGYNFDLQYQNNLKQQGCTLVCIDDLHDKEFVADLIINHAPAVKPENYNALYHTKFALGLQYALLRPQFLIQAAAKKIKHNAIKTLFICFGGSDYKNLTVQSLIIAAKFDAFKKIIVVTGAAYKYLNSLQDIITKDTRMVHYHAIGEQKMLDVLNEVDLAIVPASGILLEVLTLQIPVITGAYINNQSIFLAEMSKLKQVANSIDFCDANLTNAIQLVLQTNVEYDNIVDGHSGERINALFKQL